MEARAIIGAGGHGREILDVLRAADPGQASFRVLGFVVDPELAAPGTEVSGLPILGGFDWLEKHPEVAVICGVGEPAARRRLAERARAAGAAFFSARHPSAIVESEVELGPGTLVGARAVINGRVRLGAHAHVNVACTVSHDTVLEDYATLAPGVHVAGHCHLEEGAQVGVGARVIDRRRIGAWAVVGAGATVVRDVPPRATVVGTPARVVSEG